MSRSDFTCGVVPPATRNFQVLEGGRDRPKLRVPREVRAAIVAQIDRHGHGALAVARRNGLPLKQAIRILIDELKAEGEKQYQRGYLAGISRDLFPGGGGPGARRAA